MPSEMNEKVFLEHITGLKAIGMVCNYAKTDIWPSLALTAQGWECLWVAL